MKKIYVTVAEFLTNGGVLRVGRPLFGENVFTKEIEQVGTYLSVDDEDYITYKNTTGFQSEDGDEYLFVKINCTPIYK